MIILPQKYQPKLFMPVSEREWRAPSLAQPKDEFGNPDMTRFRVRARQRLHDGFVRTIWTGWFDSRDDFDAFSWSLAKHLAWGEPMPREDWDLPSPGWVPGMGELLEYDFATQVFITTTTGSNQTYTSPSDWNNSSNTVECVGAGASGGAITRNGGVSKATGGGGGAYAQISNFMFATPGTTTATRRLGTGGVGVTTVSADTPVSGTDGGDTWFNGTTLAGSSCGAKGGQNGSAAAGAAGDNPNGGAGGASGSGVGTVNNSGGRGGNVTSSYLGDGITGGGGAAGPNGAGGDGTNRTSSSTTGTTGGTGDNGSGGAGGGNNAAGSAGTEWDASHGPGGGGGGARRTTAGTSSGAGGNYGGASGGITCNGSGTAPNVTSAAGSQGVIVLTYTPPSGIVSTNSPMLGM